MLTTIDNPYNPYKDWYKWYQWDCSHHYYTCQLIARLCDEVVTTSEEDEEEELSMIINMIIENDSSNMYAIINEEDKTPLNEYFFKEINNQFSKVD